MALRRWGTSFTPRYAGGREIRPFFLTIRAVAIRLVPQLDAKCRLDRLEADPEGGDDPALNFPGRRIDAARFPGYLLERMNAENAEAAEHWAARGGRSTYLRRLGDLCALCVRRRDRCEPW